MKGFYIENLDKNSFIQHQIKDGGAPLPPLTPRDWQITLGDRLLRVLPIQELDSLCREYESAQPGGVVNPHGKNWDPDCILNQASA